MNYKIGDLVTRISYKHDILFRIVDINPEVVFLKGVDVRLYADAPVKDLMKSSVTSSSDLDIIKENVSKMRLDRSTYFYIPGSVLHIDGDEEYLDRCMNFYKEMNIKANGMCLNENDMPSKINSLLEEYNKVKPISKEEYHMLQVLVSYPEKFWKVANQYYNNRKSWIPEKNMQKLLQTMEQAKKKEECIQSLFGNKK